MLVKITLCMIVGLQPTMGLLYDRPNEEPYILSYKIDKNKGGLWKSPLILSYFLG